MPTIIVEEALAGLGLKLAVAPPGNPLTVKITAAVKPPEGVMLTVYVVPAPCTTLWEAGVAERVKSGTGAGLTVRVTDVVRVRVRMRRVMVSAWLWGGVVCPVHLVIVEEAVAGLGLKLAVAPPGNPLTLKVTAAVKPPEGVMLTAYVVPAPCTTLWEAGVARRVKPGNRAQGTASETDVLLVRNTLAPVMVNA